MINDSDYYDYSINGDKIIDNPAEYQSLNDDLTNFAESTIFLVCIIAISIIVLTAIVIFSGLIATFIFRKRIICLSKNTFMGRKSFKLQWSSELPWSSKLSLLNKIKLPEEIKRKIFEELFKKMKPLDPE